MENDHADGQGRHQASAVWDEAGQDGKGRPLFHGLGQLARHAQAGNHANGGKGKEHGRKEEEKALDFVVIRRRPLGIKEEPVAQGDAPFGPRCLRRTEFVVLFGYDSIEGFHDVRVLGDAGIVIKDADLACCIAVAVLFQVLGEIDDGSKMVAVK